MTQFQHAVLRWMRGRGFKYAGQWIGPVDIHCSKRLAEAIYWNVMMA